MKELYCGYGLLSTYVQTVLVGVYRCSLPMAVTCMISAAVALVVCRPEEHIAACVWMTAGATWQPGLKKAAVSCRFLTATAAGCLMWTAMTIVCVDRAASTWTRLVSSTLPISETTASRSSRTCRTSGRRRCRTMPHRSPNSVFNCTLSAAENSANCTSACSCTHCS